MEQTRNNTIRQMESNNWHRILRVNVDSNQGMRKYMEDEYSVRTSSSKSCNTAFLGVFDGHGGKEAAIYARKHLYDNIRAQPEFFEEDPEKVRNAIREGFLQTHLEMARVVDTWPKRKDGLHSTSGTTATVVILRDNKLYVAHVGDSAAVISCKSDKGFEGKELTHDHKPEDIDEKARIESLGGRVVVSNGVHRVVWKRLSRHLAPHNHVLSTPRYEYVPFLAVSRALGDLWSYDHEIGEFIVSPEPEISVIDYDPEFHKFIILASDGLWGVMNAQEAVKIVTEYEEEESDNLSTKDRNCARHLLSKSLDMWQKRRSRADNISVIVAFLDDEFGASPEDNYASDADTDVVSASEDDTPPLINDNIRLVRQLAFQEENSENKIESCPMVIPVTSSSNNVESVNINDVVEPSSLGGKRKIDDNLCAGNQKKVRTVPTTVQNGTICNVVTDLSSESLCDLQLDDELGFADDESEVISNLS